MNILTRLRIGPRLALGFLSTIAFSIAIAVFARVQLDSIGQELKLLVGDRMAKNQILTQTRSNIDRIALSARNAILAPDEGSRSAQIAAFRSARTANGELFEKLQATVQHPQGRQLLAAVQAARAPYAQTIDQVAELAAKGDAAGAAKLLLEEAKPRLEAFQAALDPFFEFQDRLTQDEVKQLEADLAFAGAAMLIAAVLALAAGALLAWAITRSVVQPLRTAMSATESVAAGDLRLQLDTSRRDETGQLLAALQRMATELGSVVTAARENAQSVAIASSQIAQGNADLSRRTEEQASNLEQTSAATEELGATVRHNADTARQAVQISDGAARAAESGGQVMERMVATMGQITGSARRIGDIIGTIDGIAFQTNILALNAAVEAARAGEQGRGFAVVAGEVRSLAQRSAEAAREIKTLISGSIEQVEAGNALAGEAGQSMGEVVQQVRRVADLINEISAASAEQSKGLGQIGEAVSGLDRSTQQNAALVEQSAAAAESLSKQAHQLSAAMASFKTA